MRYSTQLFKAALIAFFLQCHLALAFSADEFSALVEKERVHYQVPGVSVVIVKDDKIIFAEGFGVTRIDSQEKVNAQTIFQLASASKTFTAAGLGVQVDQKKLGWDEGIITFLPEAVLYDRYATRFVSARDLLAHRTGLPAFYGDLLGNLGYDRAQILQRFRFLEPATSFRNHALYSNVNYFIAGELLARLTGQTFEEAIQTTLLSPLKMHRTGFSNLLSQPNVAFPHAKVNESIQVIPREPSNVFAAAGGMCSTAEDLGHWLIMHLNGGVFEGKKVLSAEVVKEIHAPSMISEVSFTDLPPINENSCLTFALGWTNYQYHGKVVVEKGGALDGVRSIVTFIPELKMGIAVLVNLNLSVLPELIRAKFLEANLGKYDANIDQQFEEHQKNIDKLISQPAKPQNALPIGHPLENYTGEFFSDLYGSFVLVLQNKELIVKAGPAQHIGHLIPFSNDTFLLRWPQIDSGYQEVTFTFGEQGKAVSFQTETLGSFHSKKESP